MRLAFIVYVCVEISLSGGEYLNKSCKCDSQNLQHTIYGKIAQHTALGHVVVLIVVISRVYFLGRRDVIQTSA